MPEKEKDRMDFSMKDPATASSRIYVGNIGENANRNELENVFRKYGNIRGVMVSRNFGFVQFESDESANNAIANEHENKYFNRKIIVRKALEKGNQGTTANRNQANQGHQGNQGNQMQGNQMPGSQMQGNQNLNQTIPNNSNSPIPNPTPNNTSNQSQSGPNQGAPNQVPPPHSQQAQGAPHPMNNFRGGGNNNNNFNNNKDSGGNPQHNQDMFNRGQRQPWRNRRGGMNSSNNGNMRQNDRERSPIDSGRGFGNNNSSNNNINPWNSNAEQGSNRPNNNNHNNHNNNTNNFRPNNMNNPNADAPMVNQNQNFGMGQRNMPDMRPPDDNADDSSRGKIGGGVPMPGNLSAQTIRAKYPNANDCEIIVLAKPLTEYAEAIESRLKRLGLLVDLLFPNPDVPVTKVLANIASRGALFAIVVTPVNLEMRSVSVNILYGQPVEHRNMPLDDAIEFIFKNFQQLIRGDKDAVDEEPSSQLSSIPLTELRHPDSIQHLVNILAENRCLTVMQFDALIKYLQERREIQLKNELGESGSDLATGASTSQHNPAVPLQPEVDPEAELQKRIMDILNKPSITSFNPEPSFSRANAPSELHDNGRRERTSSRSQEPQLLNDPKVQRALDSLLSNNAFNF